MFLEIQERETQEILTHESLLEIRRDFGFDVEEFEGLNKEEETETAAEVEETMEEGDEYDEVIYEALDEFPEAEEEEQFESIKEEIEEEEEENIEYEVESIDYIEESVDERKPFVFKCHLCSVDPFEQMHSLSNHTRQVHKSLPKVACTCGRFLSTWESLMNHKRKHSSQQRTFKCSECDSCFRTKTGLSIHIKFKHERPTKINNCPTCGRIFKDSTVLKTHMRTHLPDEEKFAFECPICFKRMANKWSVKYHITTIHDQQKSHFCHLCGRGFGNKSNLRSHLISHSTENVECEICGNKFKNRISLQSHRKLHKPEHMRKFPCDICNKLFHNRNHLSRHMVKHSDERKFKCTFDSCMSEYKWQKDLTNHIASAHSGEFKVEGILVQFLKFF